MNVKMTQAECGEAPPLTYIKKKRKSYTLHILLVHKLYENSGCPFSHPRSTGQARGV